MYFKKLELIGFKSFFDKTSLEFEPGITAVVGPNGCGKSNIFDSIRWVLGEQSAKSLRGSEMLDVIFNGTDTKEPLGMAEVTLTFDNQNRFFNIDHEELAITRRLFRSGESEYLLNRTQVRLKDIMDLLLGTGVGAESYSIVAQGKIDLLLSSRPEDRRLVFDEASGITKYKGQKRETMRKLEETEQNLLRVNDIISEVKRQISSLERQANKARRYKQVFEELKQKEVSLASCLKNGFLIQKQEIEDQIKTLEAKQAKLIGTIEEKEGAISSSQSQLRDLESRIMLLKGEILDSDNLIVRNSEQIRFDEERKRELEATRAHLKSQAEQVKNRIHMDEDKLNEVKNECQRIEDDIAQKGGALSQKEFQINEMAQSIKCSLDKISEAKKGIIAIVAKEAAAKNEISDFSAQGQIYLSRKKRLEVEKAKVFEEKYQTQGSFDKITSEVNEVKNSVRDLTQRISAFKADSQKEKELLNQLNVQLEQLEKERLSLISYKEFLGKLKSKYEDIGESMNAVIQLDKVPDENISGLVVKIKELDRAGLRLTGEAKPIELNTQKIDEKLVSLEKKIDDLTATREQKQACLAGIENEICPLQEKVRSLELNLANKETSLSAVCEQMNKINEEEEIIVMELQDAAREILLIEKNVSERKAYLHSLELEHRQNEDLLVREEECISQNSRLREELLVSITQIKTELNALKNRVSSDEATQKILNDTYRQDCESLTNIEEQIGRSVSRTEELSVEISICENKIHELKNKAQQSRASLKESEEKFGNFSLEVQQSAKDIGIYRKQLEQSKAKLYELQMEAKDADYKYSSLKERMLQAYKVDIEPLQEASLEIQPDSLSREIETLKEKVSAYGNVNLVAIEEYDELKTRYDFLIQQQNDLVEAKEALHQAILKINRTTKQMFLETFEKVKVEFRNYFRVLFNGGDAQLFLIDEEDPLESGIEIICRPPGKKLQNVLLLSGGEKSLAAIALIFSVFKVKPSPFCILDEIDAALDEANVDRFGRILQEFASKSQFIVITHNKRTIANADVMYGITMEDSGISKIVSVKFSKGDKEEREPREAVPEAV